MQQGHKAWNKAALSSTRLDGCRPPAKDPRRVAKALCESRGSQQGLQKRMLLPPTYLLGDAFSRGQLLASREGWSTSCIHLFRMSMASSHSLCPGALSLRDRWISIVPGLPGATPPLYHTTQLVLVGGRTPLLKQSGVRARPHSPTSPCSPACVSHQTISVLQEGQHLPSHPLPATARRTGAR